jgi:hypothetical protein
MDEFISTGQVRHVYQLKWWVQLWYLALGVLIGGIGFVYIIAQTTSGDWVGSPDSRVSMLSVFLPVLGCYFVALALRSRVVLDATTISVRGAILEKSAKLCDIKGYLITETRYASYWRLELKDNIGTISIMRSFDVDDDFRTLLSHMKNLEEDYQKMFNFPS